MTIASSARTGATTGSLSGRSVFNFFLVGHVSVSDTREVDACPTACDRESAATWIAFAVTRSAEIKNAVRVHQGSLIR